MEESPFRKKERIPFTVEVAKPEDWRAYRDIRIEALTKNPEAFGATLEDALKRKDLGWKFDLSDSNRRFYVLAKSGSGISAAKSVAGAFEKEYEKSWHIIGVYTREEFRGQGLSRKVIEKILAEAKNKGGIKATLNVTENIEQEPARKLYADLGFSLIGRMEEDGEPYLIMGKDLSDIKDER